MPVDNMAEKECKRTDWWTPPRIMDPVRDYFCAIGFDGIDLDPATVDSNPCKARYVYTPETDGLAQPWDICVPRTSVWVNPPYGNLFKAFIKKVRETVEANPSVVVLAIYPFGSRSEQQYWQRDVMCEELRAICFVRKRVGFMMPPDFSCEDKKTPAQKFDNTYASGIYLYGSALTRDDVLEFAHRFSRLGVVREMGRRWAGPEE